MNILIKHYQTIEFILIPTYILNTIFNNDKTCLLFELVINALKIKKLI